jgi:hypothetical protein
MVCSTLSKNSVLTHLCYLSTYTERLIEHNDISDSDFLSFYKEFNNFITLLLGSTGIDFHLKQELVQLLDTQDDDEELAIEGIRKYLFFDSTENRNARNERLKNALREVQDRLSNILFRIEEYCFSE